MVYIQTRIAGTRIIKTELAIQLSHTTAYAVIKVNHGHARKPDEFWGW